MTKVDELIKRVRLTPEEIRASHSYWENLSDNAVKRVMVIAEAQLNKVLNDPDLYLQIIGEPSPTMDLGNGDESYCVVSYIPLAGYFKEE